MPTIRQDVRRFLKTGDPDSLERLRAIAADDPGLRVLYETVSHQTFMAAPADRIAAIAAASASQTDPVDHAVVAYVSGDVAGATAAMDALWEGAKRNRRVLLWRFYMRANQRLVTREARGSTPRVFQYWDRNPPEDVRRHMQAWGDLLGADYAAFDDERARTTVAETVGSEGVRAYDACWHPAMKSDLFRAVEIFRAGGLYVDADMQPTAATLTTLQRLNGAFHLTIGAHHRRCGIQNHVLYAAPGHRLFELFVGTCVENVLSKKLESPAGATGPAALAHTVLAYLREDSDAAEATSLSMGESEMLVAQTYRPQYKGDDRSWQRAMSNRRKAEEA